jgi:hypothetical protein
LFSFGFVSIAHRRQGPVIKLRVDYS